MDNDIITGLNKYLQGAFKTRERNDYLKENDYWINIFKKLLPGEPQLFYFSKDNDKVDLWLFSDMNILKINDFLHDPSYQKDEIEIYPLSQIIGPIDISVENYDFLDPSYDSNAKMTLKFRVNQLSTPVEITATSADCPLLEAVAKLLLKNIK